MGQSEVSLEQRQQDYFRAERLAEEAAERYIEHRAAGTLTYGDCDDMDHAQAELRRAKRRLEDTQRRLAKRRAAA